MKKMIMFFEDLWDTIRDSSILILWLLLLAIPVWIVLGSGLILIHWMFG